MAAHLITEVREWVPRERRFQILVLANLCAVLSRELRAGAEPSRADLATFNTLLGSDDVAEPADSQLEWAARDAATRLAARIRAGELDDDLPEVLEALRGHVARKLEIARPGYADQS